MSKYEKEQQRIKEIQDFIRSTSKSFSKDV